MSTDNKAKKKNDIPDDMISVREAAEMLGVSYNSVRAMIDTKHLRAVRYPQGGIRVSREAVTRLWEASEFFAIKAEEKQREEERRTRDMTQPVAPARSQAQIQQWRLEQHGKSDIPGNG